MVSFTASKPARPMPCFFAWYAHWRVFLFEMIRRDSPFVSFRRAGLNPDHSSPGQHRQAGRVLALAVLALAVVGVAIAGVVAWLTASSSLINEFGLGQVDTSVEETFDGGTTKSDVKAKNDGSVPIYVRAQVNIYWQDANGNQL